MNFSFYLHIYALLSLEFIYTNFIVLFVRYKIIKKNTKSYDAS